MDMLNLKDLKEIILVAEDELSKLKEENRRKGKQKRIAKALEKAYALLNRTDYTQKEIDKMTHIVWKSLQDNISAFWVWILGILLTGSIVFTGYETYSFIEIYIDIDFCVPGLFWWPWCHYDPVRPEESSQEESSHEESSKIEESSKQESGSKPPVVEDDLSNLVTVNHKETNIVNLTNLIPVDDEIGLKNTPQEWNIYNDSSKLPDAIDYDVYYAVNIVELNKSTDTILNKKYIKYRLTYEDYNGNTKQINGNLGDLNKNPDGSYMLIAGSQRKNANSNFSMVLWIDSKAGNSEQGKSYLFAYKVVAAIEKK